MALRHTAEFVESQLCLNGPDRDVLEVSSLSRRQMTLAVNSPQPLAPGPPHLLIDIEPSAPLLKRKS